MDRFIAGVVTEGKERKELHTLSGHIITVASSTVL